MKNCEAQTNIGHTRLIWLLVLLGVLNSINCYSQQTYTGILNHTNSYFTISPYSSSYDDGSHAKIFYDGNNKQIQFWNSNAGTDYTHINVGNVFANGYFLTYNPNNASASVYLHWYNNIARLRIGGTGSGASNGFDIQGPGNTSLLRVEGNGNVTSKGSVISKAHVISTNPSNSGATMSMSWLNNTARIRIGGSGPGASQGLDIQTTGDNSLMRLLGNGNVGIGTTTPNAKLAVNGNIHAKEVKVDLIGWPDYVFAKDYSLLTLEEVENHIKEKGHLPNIPSAHEVEENGVQLGEMNKLLLEKIEELMLYILEQEKKVKNLQVENQNQQKEIKSLKQLEERLIKIEELLNKTKR